ncbi:MAG: hypothetical protein MUD00_03680 [Candidatus Pacebacteria bacterium]|jgi:nucleotidyltransferase/DNA polymerase involved in DNA repair|nr:hypothetical protein [Candidatus Paceibacterota bacterium]
MTNKGFIIHADGDAFFAACEVARRPDLRGKAVVVGEERGIASAMTQEAKQLGIHRCMPIFEIRKTFPEAVILSSHFELYQKYHDNFISSMKKHFLYVESYSIDECFAWIPEVSEKELLVRIQKIKQEVELSLGITFSFGAARTKTLAKIASKLKKPDGCVILTQTSEIEKVLKSTDIRAVWGIGYKTSERLENRGLQTAYDFITTLSLVEVRKHFSEPIAETWQELSGVRVYTINTEFDDQKSIQATRALLKATDSPEILFSELSRNIEIACRELRALDLYAGMIHVSYSYKLGMSRHKHKCGIRRQLPIYTQNTEVLLKVAFELAKTIYTPGYIYKSTGVALSDLKQGKSIQNDLFGAQKREINVSDQWRCIDALNRKFGDFTVMYGSSLKSVSMRQEMATLRNAKDTYIYGLPLPYMGEVF